MSNNFDITINDFGNICRTCLSRNDLKPLYEQYTRPITMTEMLKTCTFIKFAEDDGLPVNICASCIYEINQVLSFAKRCETTDTILRKCANFKTGLTNNLPQSQKLEPIIKAEEEIDIEIKSEIITQDVQDSLGEFEYVGDVKLKQETAKLGFKPEFILPNPHEAAEEVAENYEFVEIKKEEDMKHEYDEIYDVLADKTYALPAHETYVANSDEDQDETYFEKCDDYDSRCRSKVSLDPHLKECVFCNQRIFEQKNPKNNSDIVHINCLRCYACKGFVENNDKYEHCNGAIYCSEQCLDANKRWPRILCAICKGIVKEKSKMITVGKLSYHIPCVKCYVCSAVPSTNVNLLCFNSAFYCLLHKPKRKPVKFKRSKITQEQADLMKKYFKENRYLKSGRAKKIGKEVGLQPGIVSVWFQNMRQRNEKKNVIT